MSNQDSYKAKVAQGFSLVGNEWSDLFDRKDLQQEYSLMRAILVRAVLDVITWGVHTREYQSAMRFFLVEKESYAFSLPFICEHLNLDHNFIVDMVTDWEDRKLKGLPLPKVTYKQNKRLFT